MDKNLDALPIPQIKKKLPVKEKKIKKEAAVHYLDSLLDKTFLTHYFKSLKL
tara:strand:- start:3185 stop:3340 length:156 start_codon:yes stop_codon:yes gene_type:complete